MLDRLDALLRADPTMQVTIGPVLLLRLQERKPAIAVQVARGAKPAENFTAATAHEAIDQIVWSLEK